VRSDRTIAIAAVGDVSFEGLVGPPSLAVFADVLPLFRRADAVIANLESPLTDVGTPLPGKCTLHGAPGWAEVLRDAGVTLVTLANNHIMDFGAEGLASTIRVLDAVGIRHVGAGFTLADSAAPVTLDIGGRRVAFLARTSVVVSAPVYAAGVATPGVAFLDADETCASIQHARGSADLVVVLIHWGLEEYRYPSPDQRTLARRFVEAGADMVIGHHPHVTQGIEHIQSSVVAYSLGNFLFGEFDWTYPSATGEAIRLFAGLSAENRQGVVLRLTAGQDGKIATDEHHTRIEASFVRQDQAAARIVESRSLSRRLLLPMYSPWWRLYAMQREWSLRLGDVLSPSVVLQKLHKLRPRHLRMAVQSARRSMNVVRERSTNPYE